MITLFMNDVEWCWKDKAGVTIEQFPRFSTEALGSETDVLGNTKVAPLKMKTVASCPDG